MNRFEHHMEKWGCMVTMLLICVATALIGIWIFG
jgi:hypothetical protein